MANHAGHLIRAQWIMQALLLPSKVAGNNGKSVGYVYLLVSQQEHFI
jgi:hypothetical protein